MKFLSSLKVAAESTVYVLSEITNCPIFQASALHAGRTEILVKKSDVPIFQEKMADLNGAKIMVAPFHQMKWDPTLQQNLKIPMNLKDVERKAYLFMKEKNKILRQAILMDLDPEDKHIILQQAESLLPKLNFHPLIKNIILKNILLEKKQLSLQKMSVDLELDSLDQVEIDPLENPNF